MIWSRKNCTCWLRLPGTHCTDYQHLSLWLYFFPCFPVLTDILFLWLVQWLYYDQMLLALQLFFHLFFSHLCSGLTVSLSARNLISEFLRSISPLSPNNWQLKIEFSVPYYVHFVSSELKCLKMDIFAYVTSLSCYLKLQRWGVCSCGKTVPYLKPHTITSGYTVKMGEKIAAC